MTEKNNVPDTTSVPGSFERVPDRVNCFRVPIHRLIADRVVRKHSARRFEVVAAEDVQIEDGQGRVLQVLTTGTHFVSITWDFNQEWHVCYIDYTVKR